MASLGRVVSWPVTGEVEARVLEALATSGTCTTTELTEALRLTTSTVHATLVRLVQAGLVRAEDGRVDLTPAGTARVEALDGSRDGAPTPPVTIDLAEIGRAVSALWSSATGAPSTGATAASPTPQALAAQRSRDDLLASDADRDDAVRLLADALSTGRLTPAEFDDRTNRALVARTYGELDAVLAGLGGLPRATARSHPWRKGAFWVLSMLLSPFVLFGVLFTLFGEDAGDTVFGVVLLVLTLPGLFGLWRWAWPRS